MRSILLYIIILFGCTRPSPLRLSSASSYDNLYTAITNAKPNDTIRITGVVDCSGRKPLEIRANNITIVGGTLRSNTTFNTVTGSLLVNYGSNNRIIGTTFQGSDNWQNVFDEIWTASHYFTGFLNYGDSALLRNCKFINCGRNGAWFYKVSGCEVDHCYFYGMMWQGTGYGLWCGSMDGGSIRIHHCYFNKNRVHIDGSGHLTNIAIDSCTFGAQTTFVPVQRHDSSKRRTFGGLNWSLVGCTFLDSIEPVRPTVPVDTSAVCRIESNVFNWTSCSNGIPAGSYFCTKPNSNVIFKDNIFKLAAAPKNPAAAAHYFYTDHGQEFESYAGRPFTSTVLDKDYQYITRSLVAPSFGGVFGTLHFAVKSSYWQANSPYTLRVLIDSGVVYTANCSRLTTWKVGSIPLVLDHKPHLLTLSVTCDSTTSDSTRTELQVFVDDIYISGWTPYGGWNKEASFESDIFYPAWNGYAIGTWSAGIRSADSYSGYRGFLIRQPFRASIVKGWEYKIVTGFVL